MVNKSNDTNNRELAAIDASSKPWYLGPYFILSAALAVVTLAFPLVSSLLDAYVLKITLSILLLGAMYAVVSERRLFKILAVFLFPLLVGNWIFDPGDDTLWSEATASVTMLFLLATTIAILANIIEAKQVTADIIFGSAAVYMLAGVIVAVLFQLLHDLTPGGAVSNLAGSGHQTFPDILYFSFISLTSVGYGDHAPISPAARTLATATGIFGQLYMAILVAKLVGIYTAQTLQNKE